MSGLTSIEDGPPKASWKSRSCLSLGDYASSWSFNCHGNWQVLVRRLSMWAIIILRTVINILAISYKTLGSRVVSVVCGVLVGLLSFAFVFWCLTMIDRAKGDRTCWCCGLVVGRTHLDIFVGVVALLHLVLLASFWQFVIHTAVGFNMVWFALWALISVYAFLCTRPPSSV